MRFYDIKGRPAEAALRAMTKNKVPARFSWTTPVILLSDVDAPGLLSRAFWLRGHTPDPFRWSVISSSSPFPLTLDVSSGTDRQPLQFTANPSGKGVGSYTGTVQVRVALLSPLSSSVTVESPDRNLQVILRVVPEVHRMMLPLISR